MPNTPTNTTTTPKTKDPLLIDTSELIILGRFLQAKGMSRSELNTYQKELKGKTYEEAMASLKTKGYNDIAGKLTLQEFFVRKYAKEGQLVGAGKYGIVDNKYKLDKYTNQKLTKATDAKRSGQVSKASLADRLEEEISFFPEIDNLVKRNKNGVITGFKDKQGAEDLQKIIAQNYSDYIAIGMTKGDSLFADAILSLTWDNNRVARAFDKIYGDFSSSRSGVDVKVVLPETREKLAAKGIKDVMQIKGQYMDMLSEQEKAEVLKVQAEIKAENYNVSPLIATADESWDQAPMEFLPINLQPTTREEKEVPKLDPDPIDPQDPAYDLQMNVIKPRIRPERFLVPPDSLQIHSKVGIDLDRLDPTRITDEQVLKKAASQERFTANELAKLPDAARRSVLTNMVATSQANVNDSVVKIDQINVANQTNADKFNIGQRDKEAQFDANEKVRYERIQFTAQAKTKEDYVKYLQQLEDNRVTSRAFDKNLDLLNAVRSNFDVDENGNLRYKDTGDLVSVSSSSLLDELAGVTGESDVPNAESDAQKKATAAKAKAKARAKAKAKANKNKTTNS